MPVLDVHIKPYEITQELKKLREEVAFLKRLIYAVPAPLPPTTAHGDDVYNSQLLGVKDGFNLQFTTSDDYITNTTRIHLNGQRLTIGVDEHYIEIGTNKILFMHAPCEGDSLMIDYKKQ